MIIVGIDPGTGVSSPTGLVIFDADGKIIFTCTISSDAKETNYRLREITAQIQGTIEMFEVDLICIETFVMRGKGGQTLQRMIGAAIATTDPVPLQEVYNTTVKRIVGGSGKADKSQVGRGVHQWFAGKSEASAKKIDKLYENAQWDILDAFAIGISGYQLYTEEA